MREVVVASEWPGFKGLRSPPWERFRDECIRRIFERGGLIVDVSGGLRLDPRRGNVWDQRNAKKFGEYLKRPNVTFLVTDCSDTYRPDRVEDVHNLTFPDSSVDGLLCIAVLEHVEDPKRAAEELVRVLKPGGMGFLYVPFLYRYHAHRHDYADYFRFSKDALFHLFRDCREVRLCPVRGIFETILKFTPLDRCAPLRGGVRMLDHAIPHLRRLSERQTSGYHVFIVK